MPPVSPGPTFECRPRQLPAGVVEAAVIQEITTLMRTPEIATKTIAAVRQQAPELNERDVIAALNDFELFRQSSG